MAFPLIPVALGLGAAYLLLGKKAAAAPVSPYAPSAPSAPGTPYVPPSTYTPPASGGLTPGQPSGDGLSTYLGTYSADPTAPTDPTGGSGSYVGPAASATGTQADPSFSDQVSNLFSTSGPALVWCDHVGGWCPYYAGHELGYPPPPGTPIFDR